MPLTILLLIFGDLGDAILTLPAVRAVRERYPDARLVLLTKAVPGAFVGDLGLVDEIVLVDKHLFDRQRDLLHPARVLTLLRLLLRLRRLRPDVLLLFHHLVTRWGTLKFALLTLASGAPRRVGLDDGRGWFLTDRVTDRGFGAQHESEYWLEVAALISAPGTNGFDVPRNALADATVDLLLAGRAPSLPILAIHAGAGSYGPGRRWPARNFARSALLVLEARKVQLVIVGTREDGEDSNELLKHLPDGAIDLVGKTSVNELAAVLRRAAVLLANDSGVGHLAAAVGTPVVSVFGPSNDRAWRPLTAVVLAADLPCRPCFYRDHERGLPDGCATRECLALVTPRMVGDQVISLLRGADSVN